MPATVANGASLANLAVTHLTRRLDGKVIEQISLGRPRSAEEADVYRTTVSKLSPFVANIVEVESKDFLNGLGLWPPNAKWIRQDPDFPDLALLSGASIRAGVELKAWFPLATEITGRFRESQSHLREAGFEVLVFAWLPEFVLWGRPRILKVWHGPAVDLAKVRDDHYFQPPEYLVVEPQDTTARTRNLQQRNVGGFVFQGTKTELARAKTIVAGWPTGSRYDTGADLQQRIQGLMASFRYRSETNFAKMDRVVSPSLEEFKERVLALPVSGKTVAEWGRLFTGGSIDDLAKLPGPE